MRVTRPVRQAVVATGLIAALALSGCSGSRDDADGAVSGSATQRVEDGNTLVSPTREPDPIVTETAPPTELVQRDGGSGTAARVEAPPAAPIQTPATYSDGLTVAVVGTRQGTVQDQGPGNVTGSEYTVFTIEVTNATSGPLDVSRVAVEARYGDPLRSAQPVYTQDSRDLAGTLEPGASTRAEYSFAIPVDALDHVTLLLDLDAQHGVAVFEGSARS